jgi:hypothetical protein
MTKSVCAPTPRGRWSEPGKKLPWQNRLNSQTVLSVGRCEHSITFDRRTAAVGAKLPFDVSRVLTVEKSGLFALLFACRLCDLPCPCRKPNQADSWCRITQCFCPMREACSLIWTALVRLFRTRALLVAEILVLRHQINIQRRHLPKRQTFSAMDRLIFAGLYRLAPNVLNALAILKPETVLKWHRAGFRSY